MNDYENILEIRNLKKYFPVEEGFLKKVTGYVKAVDNVSFSISRGSTFGLVGESGCGKTTLARTIIRALEPSAGEVYFSPEEEESVDLTSLDRKQLKHLRKEIQMIFQDPYSSLNPRLPVLELIAEPLKAFGWKREKYRERTAELLEIVGLDSRYLPRYPHAFSGGQRQRIGIARALALNPSLVIADEPVSALDVSVQAQILNLLNNLQEELGLTYLFIAHDLSVINYICDRVAVMYLGRLVEEASVEELFADPWHPYTSVLMAASPIPDPDSEWRHEEVSGSMGEPEDRDEGCAFAPRCHYADKQCFRQRPELEDVEGHRIACHRRDELDLQGVKVSAQNY